MSDVVKEPGPDTKQMPVETLDVAFDIPNRRRPIQLLLRWLFVLAVMLGILFASAIPGDKKPGDPFTHADKVQHFIAYGVLAFALYGAIRASWPRKRAMFGLLATLAAAALYGVTDEGHQYLVPGRSCSIIDWYADMIGATVVAAAMHLIRLIGGRRT